MFFYDPTIILIIPVLILAFWAQAKVKGTYRQYAKEPNSFQMTGEQVARRILDRNGLTDVRVAPVAGVLTDHYDPRTKEVRLSQDIFYGRSVSSASIAAHEVGHALQHAQGYVPLTIRASILPVANLGSTAAFPLFLAGLFFSIPFLMDLGILFFAGAFLFHLVTLPVEFNASSRAIAQLSQGWMIRQDELVHNRKVLNAAAMTYVAATLMALVQLIRLIVLRGSRD